MDSTGTAGPGGGSATPLTRWEGSRVEELRRAWGVPRLLVFARLESTNDLAIALAREGATAGTVVIAEEQTAGRGRGTRGWSSPPGLGVWMSIVLRPDSALDARVLPLLLGLAVARALTPFTDPAELRIKWPNDVLVAERKLGGILCEGAWERERLSFVVAGIGLNVSHREADFPPELRHTATSLGLATGRRPPRTEIVGALLREVLAAICRPVLEAADLAELERRDALRGREVVVTDGETETLRGVALGITADGTLQLRTRAGAIHAVRSGTVRTVDGALPHPPREREPDRRS